jgi:hypothetical protein
MAEGEGEGWGEAQRERERVNSLQKIFPWLEGGWSATAMRQRAVRRGGGEESESARETQPLPAKPDMGRPLTSWIYLNEFVRCSPGGGGEGRRRVRSPIHVGSRTRPSPFKCSRGKAKHLVLRTSTDIV